VGPPHILLLFNADLLCFHLLLSIGVRAQGIDVYIRESMELVKDVDMILTTIKDNVKETAKILKSWEKNLMFERKEGKTYTFEELNDSFKQLIQQRHSEIRDGGKSRVMGRIVNICVAPKLRFVNSWRSLRYGKHNWVA
jgi:predicted DNA-binding protein YlxM (UPF0122 family)